VICWKALRKCKLVTQKSRAGVVERVVVEEMVVMPVEASVPEGADMRVGVGQ